MGPFLFTEFLPDDDSEIANVWEGTADLDIVASPHDELVLREPTEIIGGFFHRVAASWKGGTALRSE